MASQTSQTSTEKYFPFLTSFKMKHVIFLYVVLVLASHGQILFMKTWLTNRQGFFYGPKSSVPRANYQKKPLMPYLTFRAIIPTPTKEYKQLSRRNNTCSPRNPNSTCNFWVHYNCIFNVFNLISTLNKLLSEERFLSWGRKI